jgi:hypothetical protein
MFIVADITALLLLEPRQAADLQARSLTTACIHHNTHPTQLGIAVSPTFASQVVLEPLPQAVQGAMDSHNSATLQLFVDYVRCYVGSLGAQLTEEQVLPLSGAVLPVGPAPADGSDAALWSGAGTTTSLKQLLDTQRVHFQVLHARGWFGLEERQQPIYAWIFWGNLQNSCTADSCSLTLLSLPTTQVCSPFACLSGKGDEFGSVDELVLNVRSGILLDIAAVPTVTMTDRHGQVCQLLGLGCCAGPQAVVTKMQGRGRPLQQAAHAWCTAALLSMESRLYHVCNTLFFNSLIPSCLLATVLQAVPLNRYILDFFKHRQKEELQEANGVRESEAWQDLNSFKDIIRSVSAALDHLLPAEEFDTVQYAFSRLGKDFSSRFACFNGPQQTQRHGVLRAAR